MGKRKKKKSKTDALHDFDGSRTRLLVPASSHRQRISTQTMTEGNVVGSARSRHRRHLVRKLVGYKTSPFDHFQKVNQ